MSDLEDRFRALDRVRPPDMWGDIETRQPGPGWQPPSPHRLVAAGVALAVAVAGIGLAAWAFSRHGPPVVTGFRPAPKANGKIAFSGGEQPGGPFWPSNLFVVQPDGSGLQQLTSDRWRRHSLAWSSDGSKIAYSRSGGEFPPSNIFVTDGNGRHTRQLTRQTDQYDTTPAWSPDGRTIAFARGGHNGPYEIYLMDADGRNVRQLTNGGGDHLSPSWSPDQTRIVFVETPAPNNGLMKIYEMNADGSGTHRLTKNSGWETDPDWSPDGSAIAFVLRGADENPPDRLVLMAPDGSNQHTVYQCTRGCEIESLSWAPDGTKLLMTLARGSSTGGGPRSRLFLIQRNGTGLREIDIGSPNVCCAAWQPVPVTHPGPSGPPFVSTPPSGASPSPPSETPPTLASGQIAFVRRGASTEDQGIFLITNGGPPVKLTDGYEPALSLDGSMIAFRQSHGEGETEIDVIDADGTGFRTLTKIAGNPLELAPAWSPDGRRLAYASIGGLYVMDADGSGSHKIIGSPGSFVDWTEPSWSPDESKLLYVVVFDSDNLTSIHEISADGSDDVMLKQMPLMDYRTPSWSPDGTRILFAAAPDSALPGPALFDIYVMNADGSGVRRLTHTADVSESEPAWSPDGTQIVFARDAGRGHIDIYVMFADGSGLRPLTQDSIDDISPSWAPTPP